MYNFDVLSLPLDDELGFTDATLLPQTVSSLYVLNNAYRIALQFLRENLMERLENNLELQGFTNSEITLKNPVYPNSLLKFLAPYFRDKQDYVSPDNDDTKNRKAIGAINIFYHRLKKTWKDHDRLSLKLAVENYTSKKNIESHTKAENRLLEEIDQLKAKGASQEMINCKRDMLAAKRCEIEKILSVSTIPPRECSDEIDWLEVSKTCPSIYSEFDCEIKWTNFEHPSINHGKWSQEETDRLKSLVEAVDHPDWDKIADELNTNRIAWQCCEKYQSSLNESLINSGPFSEEEINLLNKLVSELSLGDYIPWHQVAYWMENRSLAQIKHFWTKKTECLRLGAKWTDLENSVLLAAVKKHGKRNWKQVASYIPGRTNKQCRERFLLRLNIKDRKLADWSYTEDYDLITLAPGLKFRWVDMMAYLTKRNPRQIAARYDIIGKYQIAKEIATFKELQESIPRNKTFAKRNTCPELDLQLEGAKLEDFLREGQKELENSLKNCTSKPKVSRIGVGGRKRKPLTEEKVEQELIRQFRIYSVLGKLTKPAKKIARARQEQMIFDVLEDILNDYFDGKLPIKPHLLATVVESAFRKQSIGLNPSRLNYCPPIFPPNLVTTQAYQIFLYARENLRNQLSDYSFDVNQHVWHPYYRTLLGMIVSLFFWPCLLSKQPPLSTKPSSPELSSSSSTNTKATSSKKSAKRRKISNNPPMKIDYCNETREKQRHLFTKYEEYCSQTNHQDQ